MFVADPKSGLSAGEAYGSALDGAEPMHDHGGTAGSSVCMTKELSNAGVSCSGTYSSVAWDSPPTSSMCTTADAGTLAPAPSGYPFVQMFACQTTVATFTAAPNVVFWVAPPAQVGTQASTSCGSDAAPFLNMEGYAIVGLSSSASVASSGAGTPMTSVTAWGTSGHTHSVYGNVTLSGVHDEDGGAPGCGHSGISASQPQHYASGWVDSDQLYIPLMSTLLCQDDSESTSTDDTMPAGSVLLCVRAGARLRAPH